VHDFLRNETYCGGKCVIEYCIELSELMGFDECGKPVCCVLLLQSLIGLTSVSKSKFYHCLKLPSILVSFLQVINLALAFVGSIY